jgi:hypothetical protein
VSSFFSIDGSLMAFLLQVASPLLPAHFDKAAVSEEVGLVGELDGCSSASSCNPRWLGNKQTLLADLQPWNVAGSTLACLHLAS